MVIDKIKNCASCGLCVISCPKKCLKLELNKDGFYRPVLKAESQCGDCGICDAFCPANTVCGDVQPILSVSAKILDQDALSSVSSGGVCYELAKKAITDGKKVCACVYNYDEHRAEHSIISNLDELEHTKGSKYFQSYTPDAFKEIFNGEEWVVFGTPCQISAIDAFANKKLVRNKLILVDFFCHGTPSMNLWKKYITEKGKEKISKIDFRSKEFGWHAYSLKFTYSDGSACSDYKQNMFYNFFFNNLVLNDSCYDCNYKALKSKADIRVGDYWGDKFNADTKGVSCCVALTEKGKVGLESILLNCEWQQADVEDILQAQMKKSPALKKERKRVLRALRGKRKLKVINNTTLFAYRVKSKINSLLKRK